MRLRQAGALLLTYLTACAGTPRALYPEIDPAEAELAAARYELHVLTAQSGPSEPVEVDTEDFQRAMRGLARDFRPAEQPGATAHWLMEGALQSDMLAELERGRVVHGAQRDGVAAGAGGDAGVDVLRVPDALAAA